MIPDDGRDSRQLVGCRADDHPVQQDRDRGIRDRRKNPQQRETFECVGGEPRERRSCEVQEDRVWKGVVVGRKRREVKTPGENVFETMRMKDAVANRHLRVQQHQQPQIARCEADGDHADGSCAKRSPSQPLNAPYRRKQPRREARGKDKNLKGVCPYGPMPRASKAASPHATSNANAATHSEGVPSAATVVARMTIAVTPFAAACLGSRGVPPIGSNVIDATATPSLRVSCGPGSNAGVVSILTVMPLASVRRGAVATRERWPLSICSVTVTPSTPIRTFGSGTPGGRQILILIVTRQSMLRSMAGTVNSACGPVHAKTRSLFLSTE